MSNCTCHGKRHGRTCGNGFNNSEGQNLAIALAAVEPSFGIKIPTVFKKLMCGFETLHHYGQAAEFCFEVCNCCF